MLLISSCSRGLGRATALHLARSGSDVVLTYRSQQAEALAVVAQIEALGRHAVALPLDVAHSRSFPDFAAMKGTVEVLSRYLAKELGPRGIAVNVVAPGAIETDFGGGAVRDNAQRIEASGGMFL